MTAQFHERLILEGQQTSMAFCPPLPTNHPRIVTLSHEEVSAKLKDGTISPMVFSTACWRGYIATWELKDGQFFLVEINGKYQLTGTEPLFADWFSGVLRIPDGNQLHYVHMGFGSVYEFETHIKIVNGLVTDERRIDNRDKPQNYEDNALKNYPGFENNFDGDDL